MEVVKGRNTPEYNFFIYAVPALSNCAATLGDEKISEFRRMARDGESPTWGGLESLVPAAIRRAKEKAGNDFQDSVSGVRKYWWVGHNELISNGEDGYGHALPEQKEGCMVSFWEVEGIDDSRGEKVYSLRDLDGRSFPATNPNGLEVIEGSYVSVHHHEIVEVISKEDFNNYGKNSLFGQ